MNTSFRRCLGLLLTFIASPIHAEPAVITHLQELTKEPSSGMAVLVAKDGQILFQSGYGYADLEKKTLVTPETKFRIGSITKQFTAAAILRLAEEKKLAVSDPVSKFFSDFPRGQEITLHHLLTHTSGIHSYTEKPDFLSRVHNPIAPGELIAWFRPDAPDFPPGTAFRYSNSAYFLLGELVAKVSGKPFGIYLRDTFFSPLEMKDTGIYENAAPPPGIAKGYSYMDGKCEPALDWDMSWAGGAGAIFSTVGDLFRWNEALYNGRVLNSESLKSLTTPNPLPAGAEGLNYGYGLAVYEMQRLPVIGHGGGLNGWSSDLIRLPDQKCTIVTLANALPPPSDSSVPGLISKELAEHFLKDEIAKLPPLTENKNVDPKTYSDFVGNYDYKDGILTVSVKDSRLFAQLTGQKKFEIFPKAADEFFWKVADAQVRFLRNETGEVDAAQHTQNGQTFRAAKLGREGVQLTAEQLDSFVGEYQYGPTSILTVTRDGSQLLAQLTGQPKFPIFAVSTTSFEWHVVPAKVEFVNAQEGKTAKAIHSQNGVTFEAPKIK